MMTIKNNDKQGKLMKRTLLATAVAVLTLTGFGVSDTLAKTLKLQASSRAGDPISRAAIRPLPSSAI